MRRILALAALLGLCVAPAAAQSAEASVVRAVCGKRVVVLGELPSHGESRTFQAKARIVEQLVNRCGFRAVIFEAPVYDFVGFQKAAADGQATPAQLDRAIGRFWTTRELAEWRGWLFEQARRGRVNVGGLDDQVSATSDYARSTLPGLVASVSGDAECEAAVARNLYWRYGAGQEYDDAEKQRLRRCARMAADGQRAHARDADHAMLESLAGYYDREGSAAGAIDRDEAMYRNLLWQSGQLPAGTKIIVWTATVHAARRQGELPVTPLGARLAQCWGDRVAVIGFTARGGQSSMAGRPATTLAEAPAGSLEARTARADTAWTYVDRRALRSLGPVPSRLFGRFTTADWSIFFDGVMVIREEVAPTEPRR